MSLPIDAEKASKTCVIHEGGAAESHSILVTLDHDEEPKNWSLRRKWTVTILTSLGDLVCLMSGSMMAPALPLIAKDLDTSLETANMALSIFVLAFAFGPMVLAPLTEVFGRRNVWLICSSWYVVWNMACGFAEEKGLLVAARLLAGIGSSVEFVVGYSVLADCWHADQRGISFAIATFLPLLGPAIGPLLGGVVAGSIGWRWLFWILSCFDGCLIVIGLLALPETYRPVILSRKARKMTRATGRTHHSETADSRPLSAKVQTSLMRPFRLMAQQPMIQLMSILLAVNFGTLYLVLTSYATLWTKWYGQPVSKSGLHYLSLALGYTIASQVGARATDMLWKRLKHRANGETAPEYRVPLMVPGAILLPAGLLWFGWAAQSHSSWVLVDAGAAVYGCGVILNTQAMQQYVMEAYSEHVASASAASQFLRSVFAFCFPLFAPALYHDLGYGWGNTTLALVFAALSMPGPLILWFWGARIRAMGKKVG